MMAPERIEEELFGVEEIGESARRVGALEDSLGIRLVVRNPDGIKLTREGELVAAAAARMEDCLGGLRRQLEGRSEDG